MRRMTIKANPTSRPAGRRQRAGAERALPEPLAKRRVLAMLASRFFIRCHVMLIALWSLSIGVFASKLLWLAGLSSLPLRYGLATVAAYCGFLCAVRVWLAYVGLPAGRRGTGDEPARASDGADGGVDLVDCLPLPRGGAGGAARGARPVAGQGGTFDGGGASGDFDVAAADLPGLADLGETGKAAGRGAGDLLDGAADADDLFGVVLLALGLLAAAVIGAAYVFSQGPLMLAEIAFEALLAGGLLRVARRADEAGWLRAAVRVSARPALAVAALAIGLGLALQHWFPQARSLAQALGLR